ncbi:Scr1 family TA system antitoxin-like transcriptional regulator [Nocardia sp. NPDC051570]|uniref:Scr1 family TA system antitoxin-like transcriptional regulator n=1 Tax=Nocardia sp. NPDC051570 TaxID=3364324 RepID=UPI0037BD368D
MSPTVSRWELVLRIRRRREQLGVDVASILKALSIAKAYWSLFENDRRLIPEEKLRTLFTVLEFDEEEQAELLELRSAGKERGWWTRYSALFSDETMRLWGMEYGAVSVRCCESVMITGLLQTADYARAVMSTDTTFIRQAEVEQRVDVRMKRQERLFGEDPLELSCLMSEAALLQQVGGPEVLKGQLDHLISLLEEHENVDIRILPFSARGGLPQGGATFYLFDYDGPVLPTLAWHEFPVLAGFIDDAEKVQALNVSFSLVESTALSRADSLALIKQTAREIG